MKETLFAICIDGELVCTSIGTVLIFPERDIAEDYLEHGNFASTDDGILSVEEIEVTVVPHKPKILN